MTKELEFPTFAEWRLNHLPHIVSQNFERFTEKNNTTYYKLYHHHSRRGDEFYPQNVALFQFIPCDSDGKPIKHPEASDYIDSANGPIDYANASTEYCDALDRVLFKGWEIDSHHIADGYELKNEGQGRRFFLWLNEKFKSQRPCVDEFIYKLNPIPTDSATSLLSLKQPDNTGANH